MKKQKKKMKKLVTVEDRRSREEKGDTEMEKRGYDEDVNYSIKGILCRQSRK